MKRQTKSKSWKIAVCSFKGRVCPRFDLAPEILVFRIDHSQEEPAEKIEVSNLSPEKIMKVLTQRKVRVVISGGIQERFQRMLLDNKIDVIWGVRGDVRDVVHAYIRGSLQSATRSTSDVPNGPPLADRDTTGNSRGGTGPT